MLVAPAHVPAGRRIVVAVDLEKVLDRVNYDILIDQLSKRIADAGVVRLIRAHLNSGNMSDGEVQQLYLERLKQGRCRCCWRSAMIDHCIFVQCRQSPVGLSSLCRGE